MKRTFACVISTLIALSFVTSATLARKAEKKKRQVHRSAGRLIAPNLAPGAANQPTLSSAAADTTVLASYTFDTVGEPDPMAWTIVDLNDQLDNYFHVADSTELDGGVGVVLPKKPTAFLEPLSGARSMWCGVPANTAPEYCLWASLPGYGNQWHQLFTTRKLQADSVAISYTVFWDAEPGYDWTLLEWSTDSIEWFRVTVASGFTVTNGKYDGAGPYPGDGGYDAFLEEDFSFGPTQAAGATSGVTGNWWLRFRFISDTAWSSEDGLWENDGAIILDDIVVNEYDTGGTLLNTTTTTFETEPVGSHSGEHGLWTGEGAPGYKHFAQLYPGTDVLQEDPCTYDGTYFWGFFDDPSINDYNCGGHPEQGAVPFKNTRNQYMRNEIWSPWIPVSGSGEEYRLIYDVYEDLRLDGFLFHVWHVRTMSNNCYGEWRDNFNVYSGEKRRWRERSFDVSVFIEPGAEAIQFALGAWDYCGAVCGPFGPGACHSQSPLFDNVRLVRLDAGGPQFSVAQRFLLFQDNFAEDGTLAGHARADIGLDIQTHQNPRILPGDSAVVTVKTIAEDPFTGMGPAVYAYVAVWPPGQANKGGLDLEAPETRNGSTRYPFVGTQSHDGTTWYCFRMDSVFNQAGDLRSHEYCIDLNDWVFTPGDTICYVFCADDGAGNKAYFSRRQDGQGADFVTDNLWEALSSPMEFTILPAGGWSRGGHILYVDNSDNDSQSQVQFDTAFDLLGIRDLVDRYDVVGSEPRAEFFFRGGPANTLASRVKDVGAQLRDCYRVVLWSSGQLWRGAIGDGTLYVKPDDFEVLNSFLDLHPDNPGVYLAGNSLAEWWEEESTGLSAYDFRDTWMSYELNIGDHIYAGEPYNPSLTAVGSCFIHGSVPDELIAYGGCPYLNDFDLLTPTGSAAAEFNNLGTGSSYVISQTTPNSAGSTARVILSGFGFEFISDDTPGFPIDRVEHLADILAWFQSTGIAPVGVPAEAPLVNRLDNAYPNPFNPVATIRYSIRSPGVVTLRVYDVTGAVVRTLVNEKQTPRVDGFTVEWDGRNDSGGEVASGVYFYRLAAKDFVQTKKMVMLK